MPAWREIFTHFVNDVEDHYDRLRYRLETSLGGLDPIKIVPYRGYGNQQKLYLKGRVLEDKHETLATNQDDLWDNLVNMYRRLASDEVPGAQVRVSFGGQSQVVTADEEGYFEAWIELIQPLASNQTWHSVDLELISPRSDEQPGPVRASADILVPPPSARYVVISDIDDTIVRTDAAQLLRMARNVFMSNAHTRLPFPGVAAFYRALQAGRSGENNPLFFVSSSPWNLYDLLVQFFSLQNIPNPVIFLRDWGINEDELLPLDNRKHKIDLIHQMLDFYPSLPFLLIGDSGQQDPEIYQQIAAEYPERIQAIYIRNVSRSRERIDAIQALAEQAVASQSTLILADDTLSIARHAAGQGLIEPAALAEIANEKGKDEAPVSKVDELLGEEAPPASGPKATVKVQPDQGSVPKETLENAIDAGSAAGSPPPTVIVEPESDPNQPA